MNEAALIQKIRKYLATVPECFFWKEHGGQYGTAGIPDIIVCHKGRFIALGRGGEENGEAVLRSEKIFVLPGDEAFL